jgi:hypothetical protein
MVAGTLHLQFKCPPPTSSLTTGNLGLRRLLVPDILQLNEQETTVLVVSSTSRLLPLYKGAILQDIRQNNRLLPQTLRLELANETGTNLPLRCMCRS